MISKNCRQICRNFLALTSCERRRVCSILPPASHIPSHSKFSYSSDTYVTCTIFGTHMCIMHELFLVCYPISYGGVCKTSWMTLVFQLCLHLWDFYPNFRRISNSSTALSESYNLDGSRARDYCACSRCG